MQFVDLSTIAQIGATLAGFATLASAIRGTRFDSDAIFDIVGHSLLALIFALCASTFGATLGVLRALSALLAASTALMFARDVRVSIIAFQTQSRGGGDADYDRVSGTLGSIYLILGLLPPILGATVAFNALPERAALLFETALLAQIVAAALMLFDVVRRHLEFRNGPPAA